MKGYDPNHKSVRVPFLVGGKAVVYNSKGEVLVIRRSNLNAGRPGGWDFPGGGLEADEDPIEGVKREIREETGLEARTVQLIDAVAFKNKDGDNVIVVGYQAKVYSNEIQLSWEHDQYKWLTKEEALQIGLPERHKRFLEKSISSA